jgi:hypothetical protein
VGPRDGRRLRQPDGRDDGCERPRDGDPDIYQAKTGGARVETLEGIGVSLGVGGYVPR